MKISETSFEQICKSLGKNSFHIHTTVQDCLRSISSGLEFDIARKELMDGFGDVEISLHPEAAWSGGVQIENDNWKKAYDKYCEEKAEWCGKYGCD